MANEGAVWKDFVGYGKETTWGTKVVPTAWARFRGGFDFVHKAEHIRLSGTDELRSYVKFVRGNISAEGSISDLELLPDHFGLLLEAALGSVNGSVYKVKHGGLPSLSVEVSHGGLLHEYVGTKISSLEISAEAGGLLRASTSFVGRLGRDLASAETRSYSSKEPFVCHGVTLTWGGSTIRAQTATVRIENPLRYPFWEMGDIYSAESTEGVAEITGEFRAIFDSTAEFDDFIAGTERTLVISGQNTAGDTIEIKMGTVRLKDFSRDRGDQNWDQTLSFEAIYNDSDGSPIVVTITTV